MHEYYRTISQLKMANIAYKEKSYAIVGCLSDVYEPLGSGFSEIVYKDALKYGLIRYYSF